MEDVREAITGLVDAITLGGELRRQSVSKIEKIMLSFGNIEELVDYRNK